MYIVAKPRSINTKNPEYGVLDVVKLERRNYYGNVDEHYMSIEWMPFKTFEDAYNYLTEELNGDSRYFIFEFVGTEFGRIERKQ